MTHVVRAYLAYLRAGMGVMFQYRGEIVLWALWGLVNPAVMYALWASGAESAAGGSVAGYTRGQFAAYYFVIMIVGHMTAAWDIWEIGYLVRSGQMSAYLLRPMMPIWKSLADNSAYKLATLLFVVPMWAIFAWLVKPEFHTQWWQLSLGILSIFLAWAINFVLGYLIAMVAFWATKLEALGEIYFGLAVILGGRFCPLEAMPPVLMWFAWAMPFRWMYAFPSELLIGRINLPGDALAGIAVQLAWVIGAGICLRIMWKFAVRRYTAVNG